MVLPQSHRRNPMTFPAFKRAIFILEGLNGFACSIYFNYLFFFLAKNFGFGSKGNLFFGAVNGFIYIFASLYGGKFAQRRGYLQAFRVGLVTVIAALLIASVSRTVAMQLLAMSIWSIGIAFTWPVLEALSCEGENDETLPRKVGIYNVVWSGTIAVAYFVSGAIIEKLGWWSIFILPLIIHGIQLFMLTKLAPHFNSNWHKLPGAPQQSISPHKCETTTATGKTFLRMAWFANPFAYIAMNTVVPLIPKVADRLNLTATTAGFFCSVWMFARTASFFALWKWTAWHYRFGYMLAAYILLIGSFAGVLLAGNLWTLVAIQIAFGCAVGLIYYSSLFYSMDTSDTKGEHGGLHEAAIGAGLFAGPAIGLAALYIFPGMANSSAYAVTAILTAATPGLFVLRKGLNEAKGR
jgi:MFS family permease